jgi:hypothetical protein
MRNALKNIHEAALRGFVEVQVAAMCRAERLADSGKLNRRAATFGSAVGAATLAGTAYARGEGCGSDAAKKLQDFIESAANFAIGLGAGGALLMLAVGALMIIFGGTPDRVSKGMKIIKNSVIGLGILAAGLFIKFIVVNFVLGATGERRGNECLGTGGGLD